MTENGWPACGPDMLDRTPIPGTGIIIPLQKGIPSAVLKAFAADFHEFVESLNNARGGSDEGGWTPTNSVPTSNHLGGSAVDLNWSDHPMGSANAGFTAAEIAATNELLTWYEGMVYWGRNWTTPKDPMHFQLGYNTYDHLDKCLDFMRRKIRPDGFSTYRRGGSGGATPPVVVLPTVWAQQGHSGDHVKLLQQFLNDNFPLYSHLDVDGDFGPETDEVVKVFQRRVGIDADGIVGPITLAKLTQHGFNPDGNVIVGPIIVGPADDQLTMRWNMLGGKTVVEALAEIRDATTNSTDAGKTGVVVG